MILETRELHLKYGKPRIAQESHVFFPFMVVQFLISENRMHFSKQKIMYTEIQERFTLLLIVLKHVIYVIFTSIMFLMAIIARVSR